MGAYRLLLAYCVVAFHLRLTPLPHGLNLGIGAVASFCVLSGYVMTALIERHYRSLSAVGLFYLDRAARLYPQFAFYLLLTLCMVRGGIISHDLISNCASPAAVLGNLSILPIGTPQLRFLISGCLPMPQAWSLALEWTFYLTIPFILVLRLRPAALVASMAVFAGTCAGVVNENTGFTLLPGSLWIFLCGSLLATWRPADRVALQVVGAIAAAGLVLSFCYAPLDNGYTESVLLGTLTAIPCIYTLRRRPGGRIDDLAGSLSYGVFLNHFVFLWLWNIWGTAASYRAGVAVMVASTLSAALTYFTVERPFLRWRRRLRARQAPPILIGPQLTYDGTRESP